jgi:predicted RNA methylase
MTALIPRATVDEIEAHRARALALYGEAFEKLNEANRAAGSAAQSGAFGPVLTPDRYQAHKAFNMGDREAFLEDTRKGIDRAVWGYLIRATNLERLMDRTARDDFRKQLDDCPPPATADNLLATMETFLGDAPTIFARGVAEAFSKLDRRFRSHDGFKIGSRVVLSHAMSEHGGWNHYQHRDEDLRDVERAFYVFDGKPHPDRSAGIVGAIDLARPYGASAFEVECDYFRVRVFKNGNIHLYFKRDDLLNRVNLLLADYYGAALGAGADAAERHHAPKSTPAKNFGDFQSPEAVGRRVIEEAHIGPGMLVLEPNAGRGMLANLAHAKGGLLTCVEVKGKYVDELRRAFGDVRHADFLTIQRRHLPEFDRVVMNPPFDQGRDIDHVMHAFRFLKPGGRLVAVMAAGVEFREDQKTRDFRATVERSGGRFHDLPARSFEESGTNVNTVLCVMHGRG